MSDEFVVRRFLAKVEKIPDGCWIWKACRVAGYGVIVVDGKSMKAHRLSHELFKGPIPEGLDVRHSCHTRECVNPEHLSVGTRADNMRDMMIAGRHRQGLLDPEVHSQSIRRSWAKYSPRERAERIHKVTLALTGKPFTEEHLTNLRKSPANQKGRPPRAVGDRLPQTSFNAEQVLAIREKYALGIKQDELAKEFHVSREAIANVVRGRAYKWVVTGKVKRSFGYGTKKKSEISVHGNTGRSHPGRIYTPEEIERYREMRRQWWAKRKGTDA